MADSSYVQSNFLGGEFSPAFQGRFDLDDYKRGLALCLNYIPRQEGSLVGRSGFMRCGNTKHNDPAKLFPFRFTSTAPYVAEMTDANLRLWSNGIPIFDTVYVRVASVTGDPPVFTLTMQSPLSGTGVPPSWNTGDSIWVWYNSQLDMEAQPALAPPREFTITIVSRSAGTITLSDAETGSPLTGTISFGGDLPYFYRILDLATPYMHPEGIRMVEHTDQAAISVPSTNELNFTQPDQRATFLYPIVPPYSISYQRSQRIATVGIGVAPSDFINSDMALMMDSLIDGPYFDSPSTTTPLVVSGTSGEITVTLHQWDSGTRYVRGDLVADYLQADGLDPLYYMSLTDDNIGNALPASANGGAVSANWLQLNFQRNGYNGGTGASSFAFSIGQAVTADPYDTGVVAKTALPVYYSKINSNTGHNPPTSPTQWQTTPPTWSVSATYAAGSIVEWTDGNDYVATSAPSVGVSPGNSPWVQLPITIEEACTTITDIAVGWLSGPLFRIDDAGGSTSALGINYGTNNPGRLFRMKWSPQPWLTAATYNTGDQVNYNDVLYKSLTNSNTGNFPDQDAVNWQILTQTILWTWGEIVDAEQHMFRAKIVIKGPPLPSAIPVWEFRFGVFSDTTGWPRVGGFHEGRLYLAGSTPNRCDAGAPDQGFNFAPTAPDGTVSDGNAIAVVLNSKKLETVRAFGSITEGMMMFTDQGEWLISASAMNDPITPTSVQAHKTTSWSAFDGEVEQVPTGLMAIQAGGRRVMEYRQFIDMTSYQSRMNALDLTRKCQHLTYGGVGRTQYQTLSQPILWVSPESRMDTQWAPDVINLCPILNNKPPLVVVPGNSGMFGIGYLRAPDISYEAPFSFEHGQTYAGTPLTVSSIGVQTAWQPGQENLYTVVSGSDDKHFVEMMLPLFETDPLATIFNEDGTVNEYGTVASAYMVDSGITPAGAKIAGDALSVTFYGMMPLAGKTVQFTCMGKYVGDYTIGADGSVSVTFNSAFALADLGAAMNTFPDFITHVDGYVHQNELETQAFFNWFTLDPNGTTVPTNIARSSGIYYAQGFYGQFGYKFRRRGQMLRPITGSVNGPPFAKIIQNDKAGIYVDGCHAVSAGGDFDNLVPIRLTKNGNKDVRALGPGDFVTGIFRANIKDGYTFNGQICWEQTEPTPGAVLAVGGFDEIADI